MLKKLLKYDLKSVYKVLVTFYLLAFIFGVLSRLTYTFAPSSTVTTILVNILNGFCISMLVSALINNFMRCWVRFNNNLYGDESYLTHTLPVKKDKIYLSKFLTAFISLFTTTLVLLASLFIMYYTKANFEVLKTILQSTAILYDSNVFNLILIISLVLFLEMLFIVLIGYVGLLIGHRANDKKMVKSIISGFILYLITQGITLLIIYIFGLFNNDIMLLFTSEKAPNINVVKMVMRTGIIIYLIYNVTYYIVGKIIFKKGINVE